MKEIGITKESADCFGIWLSSKHLSKYTEISLDFKCINFPPSHACELTVLYSLVCTLKDYNIVQWQ